MPGPGGGSHGGGFGGGSFGGGHGGGGFGGPPRGGGFGGPHRGGFGWHRRGGFFFGGPMFFGPRFGGGCLGWFLAPVLFTGIALFILAIFLFSFVGSGVSNLTSGGSIVYDETAYQDYANDAYMRAFGNGNEDGLLILISTNDEANGYYAIAWVGDNLKREVSDLFGDEYTAFGRAMENTIGYKTFKYSLDTDLAAMAETMKDEVLEAAPSGSYRGTAPADPTSYLENRSEDVVMTEQTVNDALADFTSATGIPCVIVVEDVDEILERKLDGSAIFFILFLLVFVGVGVFGIFRAVRAKREYENGGNGSSGGFNSGSGGYDHW